MISVSPSAAGPHQLGHRLRVAGERPQLGADDRLCLEQERARRAQRRPEVACERPQVSERLAQLRAQRLDLGQRGVRLAQRLRQLAQRLAQPAILVGEGAEDGVVGVDEARQLVVLAAELLGQQAEVVHGPLDVARAYGELAVEPDRVAPEGLEAPQRVGQLAALSAHRLARAPEQQLQRRPRVAVERRQELVEVHVRQRPVDRDREAVGRLARGACARIDLQHHVVEAGLRAQHRRGVAVERVVGVDLHRHDRPPVHEVDLRQLAHVDPGDLHRLALAGGDGLGGRHLRLVHGELRADARHPAGQRQTLLGEDVAAHDGGDQGERDDRDELLAVLADRAHHGRPPPRALAAAAVAVEPWASDGPVRAVRSGLRCVWQATSVRRGGFVAGQAGRVPRGLAGRLP